jgi:hypothetical protein
MSFLAVIGDASKKILVFPSRKLFNPFLVQRMKFGKLRQMHAYGAVDAN